MKRHLAVAPLVALFVILASVGAFAESTRTTNAQRALQWLTCSQQQANGQIGSGGNAIARSSEVALGLAAAGQPASAMQHGDASLADYLRTATSTDVGTNGELLLARASQPSAGPTATVAAQLQAAKALSGPSQGEYGSDLYSDALAILGLRAAEQPVTTDSITFLRAHQQADGGWSFDNADQYGEDSNTTALVLQALIAAGVSADDPAISKGFSYLQSVFSQGGFGDAPGSAPDPNSDELVVLAAVAAGRQTDTIWNSMINDAVDNLSSQQLGSGADAGAIASSFSKLFATTQAPNAFLLRPLTVGGIAEARIALLPCASAAAASASPTIRPAPVATTVRLAQTGQPRQAMPSWPLPLGVLVLLCGATLARGRTRSSR